MRFLSCLKLKQNLLGLALMAAAPMASAGMYLGVSAGESRIEYKHPDPNLSFDPKDLELSDSDPGMKIFGGYKFTIAAIEFAYVDFGRIENNEDYAEVTGLSAFGVLHLGLGPVGVFGKVGGFMWESEVSFDALEAAKETGDGYDLAYGLGVQAGILDIDARLEYEYFNVDDVEDVSMVSVGVSYTF